MLSILCLAWIGMQLSAPTWYFVLIWIMAVIKTLEWFSMFYKAGKKSAEDK